MICDDLDFRLASEDDFDGFFSLKSEAENIYWSGFGSVPDKCRLKNHFLSAIKSDSRDFYILFYDDRAIGFMYIDYDPAEYVAEIAYGISRCMSGQGLAKIMIAKGLDNLRSEYRFVVAWIAEANIPSIKSVKALGFIKTNVEEDRKFVQETAPVRFQKYIKSLGVSDEL